MGGCLPPLYLRSTPRLPPRLEELLRRELCEALQLAWLGLGLGLGLGDAVRVRLRLGLGLGSP